MSGGLIALGSFAVAEIAAALDDPQFDVILFMLPAIAWACILFEKSRV
jgi:hypothetical protein